MNWRSECLSHEALSARKAATTSLGRLNLGHQMALVFNSKISPPAKTKNKEEKKANENNKAAKNNEPVFIFIKKNNNCTLITRHKSKG